MSSVLNALLEGYRVRTAHGVDEDGFSLIEFLIATTIGIIIITLVMASLPLFVETGENGVALAQADNTANTALSAIEEQVVAGQVIFSPTTEATNAGATLKKYPGYSLRVLTSATTPTACYQLRVVVVTKQHPTKLTKTAPETPTKTKVLQVRSWPNDDPSLVTTWSNLATGLRNTGSTQKPFQLDTTKAFGNRMLDADLVLRASQTKTHTHHQFVTTRVHASYAASDAQFFTKADSQFCNPVPSP